LKDQAADNLHLFFRDTGAFSQEDKDGIASVQRTFKVNQIIGSEHEPEIFRKQQRLKPR